MVSTHLRDQHREFLCDALAAVEPTAPTLCEGWDAHELAVHIWVLQHDPLSWPGVMIPALAGATRRRAELIRGRWSHGALVARLRREPGSLACMPLDRWEGHGHALGEYYIHTQDVLRANGLPRPTQSTESEDALWVRARKAGGLMWDRNRGAVRFTAPHQPAFTVGRGTPATHVDGLPSEVILWLYGRGDAADVKVTTPSDPVHE